jgi:hypothetical protein
LFDIYKVGFVFFNNRKYSNKSVDIKLNAHDALLPNRHYVRSQSKTFWKPNKVQKDKQRSTNHIYKTKDQITRTPLKTGGELRCPGRVRSNLNRIWQCCLESLIYLFPNTFKLFGFQNVLLCVWSLRCLFFFDIRILITCLWCLQTLLTHAWGRLALVLATVQITNGPEEET